MNLLISLTNELTGIIQAIEGKNLEITRHNSNATMSNLGAAAAYFLTNNSKNQTTRIVGQVAAVGGLIHGSNQRNKASEIKSSNYNLLKQAIEKILNLPFDSFRREANPETKRIFLQKTLTISSYFDKFVEEHASSLKTNSALSSNKQNILMTLNNQEVFYYKIKLLDFLKKIDHSIFDTQHLHFYQRDLALINKEKLKNESYLMLGLIFFLSALGFVFILSSTGFSGLFFLISALTLYLIHTFYPFLNQTKKLKLNANRFVNEILKTVSINRLNY
jgi:hypothetical protein